MIYAITIYTIYITLADLNLSHNKLSRLPEEFASLTALTKLNISNNSFIVLPQVVFKLQSLASLDAQHNAILGKSLDLRPPCIPSYQ